MFPANCGIHMLFNPKDRSQKSPKCTMFCNLEAELVIHLFMQQLLSITSNFPGDQKMH